MGRTCPCSTAIESVIRPAKSAPLGALFAEEKLEDWIASGANCMHSNMATHENPTFKDACSSVNSQIE
jgi:hypothetical protein